MADVLLSKVRKNYNPATLKDTLRNINLDIKDGDFIVFVGPSGCGKSTLLRMIAGLEDITSGDLTIGGKRMNDVPPSERNIGMVFQSYALYPHMTVFENMAFGLKLKHMDKETIRQRVVHAADILGLEPFLERKPKALSGGQRQRVAIGRCIVQQPSVFLFDEPLSNLDAALRVKMRLEIAKLHRDINATIIYVTHDQVEAMTLADKICVLSPLKASAESNLEQFGTPLELYNHPVNQFVAGFIGSPKMNFLNGEITEIGDKECKVKLTSGEIITAKVNASRGEVGQKVQLGVRPEHLVAADSPKADGGKISGKVIVTENLGAEFFLYMEAPACDEGVDFTVKHEFAIDIKAGETYSVGIPASACHLFDAEGLAFPRTEVYTRG
ncbi:MAG: sn-glycerol-3-phosphate ABC transporter ATP-binding protein UgpC [Succinivibrio sp.]|jgi:multiple sugar transport system ATP-binding protein|nr:sn-glycerol-3-phosphate ABC transporter ATP-binding protein UgpC [Succinivibrio sp.]